MKKQLRPVHPGEVLREEFLIPNAVTSYRLAKDIDVPAPRIYEIVNEERSISADTALRLSHYFGTSPEFWMNLQIQYDLDTEKRALGTQLEKLEQLTTAA